MWAIIHKLIEVIPLTALSSSLLLNWRTTCFQSYLTLAALTSSLLVSIFFSDIQLDLTDIPYLTIIILAFFPFAFSTEIAKLLLVQGYANDL